MIVDVLGAQKQAEVQEDTWGHLRPKQGEHKGHILFAVGCYHETIVITANFGEATPSSPWFFEALHAYVLRVAAPTGKPRLEGLYRFDGICRVHNDRIRFVGRVRVMKAVPKVRRSTRTNRETTT